MKLSYIATSIVVLCAAGIGALIVMGPKLGLQMPPIEQKAKEYLDKHNLIKHDEKLSGYKAISLYSYSHAAVITNKRVFIYNNDKIHSIPLKKITLVNVKDTELGRQEVLISAQKDGVIILELPHTSVSQLLHILKVPSAIVKYNGQSKHLAKEMPAKSQPHVAPNVQVVNPGKV